MKINPKTIGSLAIASTLAATSLSASGAVVYSEDFDGLTVGETLEDVGAPWGGAGYAAYSIITGTAGLSGNQLQMDASAAAWTFVDNLQQPGNDSGIASIQFDLVNTDLTDGYLRVALSRATANLGFWDIRAAGLSAGVNSVAIVLNVTGASIDYDGSNTLANNTSDIWVNGVKNPATGISFANQAGNNGPSGAGLPDGFGLWMNGGGTVGDQLVLDNLVYLDNASAVPEPSSAAILGLLGVAGLIRRRR